MIQKSSLLRAACAGATITMLTVSGAAAKSIAVTITSNQAAGGLYLTPLLTALHDGTYNAFDAGSPASASLEALAEEGNPAPEIAANPGVNFSVITSPGGFPGAPVIDPGESATVRINVDENTERFLSFLSMVIPSNDSFVGNDNSTAYEIFDGAGNFTGIAPIEITGNEVWNAGTELDNNIGAAFNAAGGVGTDENGVVGLLADLNFLVGQNTAAGTTINTVPGPTDLLATITVSAVPVPAALPLLMGALGGLAFLRRRRS